MATVPSDGPRRALLCPRVSSDDQWDGTSIDHQERAMRQRCAERGWDVVGVHADAESGAVLWERPQFQQISRHVQTGAADVVLFYESSRLARDMAYSYIVLELCERFDVRLDFVLSDYEREPDGRMTTRAKLNFGLDAWKAEDERKAIIRRTSDGRADKYAAGEFMPQGRPPYGYKRVETLLGESKWDEVGNRVKRKLRDVRYERDSDTAPVVERIVRWYIEGRTLRGIAKLLNDLGEPTPAQRAGIMPKGRPTAGVWAPRAVFDVLIHPFYYGLMAQHRWEARKHPVSGKTVMRRRPPEQFAPITDGRVPPLLPPDLRPHHAAILARLALNKAVAARNNPDITSTLLRAGIARCGYCGCALSTRPPDKRILGDTDRRYVCAAAIRKDHPRFAIRASIVDRQVWDWVSDVFRTPELIEEQAARHAEAPPPVDTAALEATERAIAQADEELTAYAENLGKLRGPAADRVAALMESTQQRYERLLAERVALRSAVEKQVEARKRVDDAVDWARRVARKMAGASYTRRRATLKALRARVRIWGAAHPVRFDLAAWIPTERGAQEVVFASPRASEHNGPGLLLYWRSAA